VSHLVAFARDVLGIVHLPKVRVLLDVRQEVPQALVLFQKGVISRVLKPPPHLYDSLYDRATEPNREADEADHGQNQRTKAKYLFYHRPPPRKDSFLLLKECCPQQASLKRERQGKSGLTLHIAVFGYLPTYIPNYVRGVSISLSASD
jgi:hypothetical protein